MDSLRVATSGSVPLKFWCRECGNMMLVEDQERPVFMFCGEPTCGQFLLRKEIREACRG